jgi:hypothetical protein
MAEEFPNGSKVVLKLPEFKVQSDLEDSQKMERLNYLVKNTRAAFAHKVYGVVRSKNYDGTYSVEWNVRDSPNTIVIDMDRSEIERLPYQKYPGNVRPLVTTQTPNNLTPDEIQAAAQAVNPDTEQGAGKRARKSRKVRKSRKSHKKYRKSRKVRKSRRRARR